MKRSPVEAINLLLDDLLTEYNLASDTALARFLELSPSIVCRLRAGDYPVSPRVILAIHEATDISVQDIRTLIA
ncbi:hypothetical protein E4K72_03515 [Oxalobacteraceae bacterium OM1]|nr:hypothetical protein E4K72_03515 [Oxalobacteraceae bacterium OM1]